MSLIAASAGNYDLALAVAALAFVIEEIIALPLL